MEKSFEVHNSCLKPRNLALKFREIVVKKAVTYSPCIVSYSDFIALNTRRNKRNKVCGIVWKTKPVKQSANITAICIAVQKIIQILLYARVYFEKQQ